MYKVVGWDTELIYQETERLSEARRICRELGHLEDNNGAWYLPIAYVENARGECVYNPQFKVGKGAKNDEVDYVCSECGRPLTAKDD